MDEDDSNALFGCLAAFGLLCASFLMWGAIVRIIAFIVNVLRNARF